MMAEENAILKILGAGPKTRTPGNVGSGDETREGTLDARQYVGDNGFIDGRLKGAPPVEGMTAYDDVQQALGYLWVEEVAGLLGVRDGLGRSPVIVNIGAGGGTSGSIWMYRPDATVYSVDKENGDSPLGSLLSEEILLRRYGMYDPNRYVQICSDSILAGEAYDGPQIDLLFIDGDHGFKGCLGDFLAWQPHLKQGALVAFHDVASWSGVTQVVAMLEEIGVFGKPYAQFGSINVYTIASPDGLDIARGALLDGKYTGHSRRGEPGEVGAAEPQATPKGKKPPRRRKPSR